LPPYNPGRRATPHARHSTVPFATHNTKAYESSAAIVIKEKGTTCCAAPCKLLMEHQVPGH